jgi:HAD superfamily hydrolase (TIGR01509 family)
VIRAIIFDFFGVLVTEGFKRFCDRYFPDNKQRRREALRLVTLHDWGKLSKQDYVSGLAKLAQVDEKIVREHMGDNEPNDALLDYIRTELKPHYKIGVLSNSGDDYLSRILEPQDQRLFDDIVLSYQHGIVKPHAEIFEFAAQRLGLAPGECLLVDDSRNHVEGARRAGMKAILYKDFPNFKTDIKKALAAVTDN